MDNRILLVDDEEEFTLALGKRLRARGLEVETAETGEIALEKAAQRSFDAVVLDLAMPGMDGIETLERLLALDPASQVILLTGHGTVHAGVEAMKLGAMDFLEKPAEFGDLLDRIRKAIANRMRLTTEQTDEQVAEILRKKGW